jgi:hypothetical protein
MEFGTRLTDLPNILIVDNVAAPNPDLAHRRSRHRPYARRRHCAGEPAVGTGYAAKRRASVAVVARTVRSSLIVQGASFVTRSFIPDHRRPRGVC